jgi:ubiquinone/menaquinone biosynthesis C-methylase UbiE
MHVLAVWISMLAAHPQKADFEAWYAREDPWGIAGSESDRLRVERINREFCGCRFESGLDICCGEGHATARFRFLEAVTGVDLSETAIARARRNYPNIRFVAANLIDLSMFEASSFNFISCLETLYNLTLEEQRGALAQIRRLGKPDCVYLFSVETTGPNNARAYHTLDSARAVLSQSFQIQREFAVTMGALPYWRKVLVKLHLSSKKEQRKQHLFEGNVSGAYQVAFVCH